METPIFSFLPSAAGAVVGVEELALEEASPDPHPNTIRAAAAMRPNLSRFRDFMRLISVRVESELQEE